MDGRCLINDAATVRPSGTLPAWSESRSAHRGSIRRTGKCARDIHLPVPLKPTAADDRTDGLLVELRPSPTTPVTRRLSVFSPDCRKCRLRSASIALVLCRRVETSSLVLTALLSVWRHKSRLVLPPRGWMTRLRWSLPSRVGDEVRWQFPSQATQRMRPRSSPDGMQVAVQPATQKRAFSGHPEFAGDGEIRPCLAHGFSQYRRLNQIADPSWLSVAQDFETAPAKMRGRPIVFRP